jgi:hypothetical protein
MSAKNSVVKSSHTKSMSRRVPRTKPRQIRTAHVNQDCQEHHDFLNSKDSQRSAKKNNESSRNNLVTFEQELKNGVPTSLTLEEYVRAAYQYDQAHPLLNEPGNWHSPLFNFVRLVKGHPQFRMLEASEALERIECIMMTWGCDRGVDVWKQYLLVEEDADELRLDFLNCWGEVKFPVGYEPLKDALRKADVAPLKPPKAGGPGFQRFVSLAGWLQERQGDQNIMLPLEKLSALLDVSTHTIHLYRKNAIAQGLLKEVRPYTPPCSGVGRATEFRFAADRYPELLGGKKS